MGKIGWKREILAAAAALSCDALDRAVFCPACLAVIRKVLDIFRYGEDLSAFLAGSCDHSPLCSVFCFTVCTVIGDMLPCGIVGDWLATGLTGFLHMLLCREHLCLYSRRLFGKQFFQPLEQGFVSSFSIVPQSSAFMALS